MVGVPASRNASTARLEAKRFSFITSFCTPSVLVLLPLLPKGVKMRVNVDCKELAVSSMKKGIILYCYDPSLVSIKKGDE